MAIISFWSSGKGETAKSASMSAITTFLAINHSYKVLIFDTSHNDYSYQDCFFREDKTVKLMINSNKVSIGSGIDGLAKAVLSNKTSPEIITNFTEAIFRENRFELLTSTELSESEYETDEKAFVNIAKMANKYYDLVFIDIDTHLNSHIQNELLENSHIIVANLSQRKREIDEFVRVKNSNGVFKSKKVMPLLGRYDKHSKYNAKNIARYMKEKQMICTIPYNTLFFEACNEGKVVDYFIGLRRVNFNSRNKLFLDSVKQTAEKIIYILQELQMGI